MTRITIEIPQGQDAEFLLSLLRRLNYRVVQNQEGIPSEHGKTTLTDLPEAWVSIVKPIRQSQSIEDMIEEQNYPGFNRAAFDKINKELDVDDREGELLNLLHA